MQKETIIILGVFAIGLLALGLVAFWTGAESTALTVGFGGMFGLCSIAFTQHLALSKARKERLQEARGLARALAAEIEIFGHVLLAKGHTLELSVGTEGEGDEGSDPDDMLRYVELPSRVVFDANASNIALLEVVEELGELSPDEDGFVERVVGFYEALTDFRSGMSAAKLQRRKLTPQEVLELKGRLISRADFASAISQRLKEFSSLSQGP